MREVCEVRYRHRNWVIDWTLHSTVQAAMVELVRDVGLTPERVLDFGTGSGVSAETLRAVLATRVVGCDMSWKTLAAAGVPNTVAVAPDGPLPFVSRVFDLVHGQTGLPRGELLRQRDRPVPGPDAPRRLGTGTDPARTSR